MNKEKQHLIELLNKIDNTKKELKQLNKEYKTAFEDVCKSFLRQKNRNEELPFYFSKIGRWWNKTDELDIMAVDRLKKNYILGECKYRNQAFEMSDLRNMQKKISWQKEDINVYYWIFSKSGYTEEVRKAAQEENIQLAELQEIILGT